MKSQDLYRNQQLLTEYKNALDLSALVFKIDLYRNITYVNDNLLTLSGYKEIEVVGQKLENVIQNDVSKGRIKNILKELRKNAFYKGTIKAYKKNRDYFYADVTIVRISDDNYISTEYMVIANDVTELIDARIEAQKAAKAKEYFLSNMSHEIRTPLNAILGFVNLLIGENISKKHRNYLNIILNSGENLLSIINDILDFSKLRSGEFSIEPTNFLIHDELSHVMELFVASANAKNITITSFINPDIPKELYADALRIKQILSNFLSNAIKFTPTNGVIHVESSCSEKMLNISVIDNGVGIPKKDIKNIFSAFTQSGHNLKNNIEGTGLGLSICSQLVKHMNGSINVESEVGVGSTFSVALPVEFNAQQCKLYDNIKDFQDLKIILYTKEKSISFGHKSFLKYATAFNMDIEIVEDFDREFDIALLIYEEITQELKNIIINSDKKYIVLMSRVYDDYDKYQNINSMCFPIYCSKLHDTFSELIYSQTHHLCKHEKTTKFIGYILVVEDNRANQELIKSILTKFGLSFDVAVNGLDAIKLYKANQYDLILMDERMPVMNGEEASKQIVEYEKQNSLKHTPISALSANVIKEVSGKSTLSFYDYFLTKPIILKDLENLFFKYLYVNTNNIDENFREQEPMLKTIMGIDTKRLLKELMLGDEELVQLLELFIKKMNTLLPELKDAIQNFDYSKIAILSHSIKGSSANFRVESLRNYTDEMEKMADDKNNGYNYLKTYNKIEKIIKEIKII